MTGNPRNIALEPAAQAFVDATSGPPYLYQLPVAEGRAAVDGVQDADIFKPGVDEEWIEVAGGPSGTVRVKIVKPVGAGAAVVFPEYDRSPEVRYPHAIEQAYAVAQWVTAKGGDTGLDPSRIAVAGDSVGGNMSAALTLLAKERGDVTFTGQVLFYPVTDASFDTASYHEFADGYFLTRDGMKWFWDQYTTSAEDRAQITASPLRATVEQLSGLPQALVITGEADVLRDEGEAYAAKLRQAGVPVTAVRYQGIVHDFVMVNSLHDTYAAKAAVAQAVAFLKDALA